jgi:hypothetical protein
MNKKDKECLSHFHDQFEHQWKLNQSARDNYDDDFEHYVGYRNPDSYPLAYSLFFPQLLPRILTMLSRMLEQLYQGGPDNFVGVRPRKRADVERAPRVAGLLNYQLEHLNQIDQAGASYLFNLMWMTNALSWGKGIAKVYWRKEERISPKRIYLPVPVMRNGQLVGIEQKSVVVEAPQVIYDAPYAEVLHNKLFVPHPHFKSIQQMPAVFVVYRRSIDYIKKMTDRGIYRKDFLRKLKAGGGVEPTAGDKSYEAVTKSIAIEGFEFGQTKTKGLTPGIDMVEGYGKYIFPGDDTPYEIGSGLKIKGKESEAIVHFDGNGKGLAKLQKNQYGYRPFFDIAGFMHPESYWDMGVIRLGKDLEDQYNTLMNTRHQNAIMSVNQMLKVRQDADIPPESLIWKPYGLIPVEDMNDVEPLITPDMTQTGVFREQEEFFKSTIEDMTGMYRYNMGATPTRQENVGTMYSLQAMGESRVKLLLMTMDYQGFQPMLRYMMQLNTWHLPDDFEARIATKEGDQFSPLFPGDIHPEYDFTARYTAMEPALGKQFRAQQLIQYAQMWQESPYLQHHEFMKAILGLMDFHETDKYLKTPEQVAQEQQAMQQQAVQQQVMQMGLQEKMAANSDQRKLLGDAVKGLLK